MNLSNSPLKIVALASGCALSLTTLHAATINQAANSSAGSTHWNASALWGSAPNVG